MTFFIGVFITNLVQIKAFLYYQNCPYFHTPKNNQLLDYYKIISISRPILVSGQYGCLFSRCRKYV